MKYSVYNFLYNKNFKEMSYDETLKICNDIVEIININQKNGNNYGTIFPISEFIYDVKSDSITDYDGFGYFINKDGNYISSIICNFDWLNKNIPKEAKYVVWFNK